MLLTEIEVDRNSRVPLHVQIAQSLEAAIHNGHLVPGQRLESEMELAARLHLSRPTLRQGIEALVRQGLLVRKRGIGTQVVAGAVRRSVDLTSLFDDLAKSGRHPSTDVTSLTLSPGDDAILDRLHLPPGAEVYHIIRTRSVDGMPLAIMENWVPGTTAELNAGLLKSRGLYDILRKAGVNPRVASQRIGATTADANQAAVLNTDAGTALITMERTTSNDEGRVIETGRHLYRADNYSFNVTLVQR